MSKKKITIISAIIVAALIVDRIGAYFGYFKPHNEAIKEENIRCVHKYLLR